MINNYFMYSFQSPILVLRQGVAFCGSCVVWELRCVGLALCESCVVWELWRVGVAVCGDCSVGELRCEGVKL